MWDDQRAFLAVIEEGSLSAAARRLGLAQPTVRARIEALEAALGTALFVRSVRGLTPTPQARTLATSARAMAHASDAFVRRASAGADQPAGTVRISVAEFIGVEVIPPMLARLGALYPDIAIELVLSDTGADLLDQQVDVAVRMFPPTQAGLAIHKVASIRLGLYAHPDYLARHGEPATVGELGSHRLIGPDRNSSDLALAQAFIPDLDRRAFVLRTDSHPAALAAARAGIGIGVVHRHVGDADMRLRPVLPDIDVDALDTWIVTHEDLSNISCIRIVFDHLVAEFTALH